jgi:hypothetical protein
VTSADRANTARDIANTMRRTPRSTNVMENSLPYARDDRSALKIIQSPGGGGLEESRRKPVLLTRLR